MRRGDYGDPAEVLQWHQERSCKGCEHAGTIFSLPTCNKGKKPGRRCRLYLGRKAMTRDDEKQVEEVLAIWFRWQERESNKEIMSHFYPATDRSCGFDPDAVRGGQDSGHDYLSAIGETVDALVDKLPGDLRSAIFTVMRNRSGAPQVWRTGRVPDFKLSFHEAKVRLFSLMVASGVVEVAEV